MMSPDPAPPRPAALPDSQHLWSGRFAGAPDEEVFRFQASLAFDRQLFEDDVEGSLAWSEALESAGVLAHDDAVAIRAALTEIREIGRRDPDFVAGSDEDVHAFVERQLVDRLGDVARRLHTGRSRNEQVSLDLRLYLGRRLPTQSVHHEPTLDTNGYFNQYGQGKKSISIDMGTAEGRALAKRLALGCDLVVSNYATGVMDEWGLGYEALAAERPDVIVGAISGYGHHGPYKSYMGYGPTTGPLSGLASMTGYPGSAADELGVSLGDPAAGIATAFALVAALVVRRRTGEGQFIDTSMWEATTACTAEGWMEWVLSGSQPSPMGNWDPLWAPHNLYRCAGEDDWVAICCTDEAEWAALARVVGIDGSDERFATAAARKAGEAELDKLIGAWTRERDQWDVTELLQEAGVPALPSLSSRSLEQNPHLAARGLIERLDHPVVGQMSHVGIPWLLTDGTNGVRSPAPTLGQHTHEVLTDVLGLSEAEIAALEAAGALR